MQDEADATPTATEDGIEAAARRVVLGNDAQSLITSPQTLARVAQLAERLSECIPRVQAGTYRFSPYQERLRPRGAERRPRVISLPSDIDAAVLHYIKKALYSQVPTVRAMPLPRTLLRAVKLKMKDSAVRGMMVVRGDIQDFYPSVLHSSVERALKGAGNVDNALSSLLLEAIRTPTRGRGIRRGRANSRGIPQGLPVSNALASLVLQEFDQALSSSTFFYARYVDDFLMIVQPRDQAAAKLLASTTLEADGLTPNGSKWQESSTQMGTSFLGFDLSQLGARISPKGITQILTSIASEVSRHRDAISWSEQSKPSGMALELLLELVDERLVGAVAGGRVYGWLGYYSDTDDDAQLHQLQAAVQRLILRRIPEFPVDQLRSLVDFRYRIRRGDLEGLFRYDNIRTTDDARTFLVRRRILSPSAASSISDDAVRRAFETYQRRRIRSIAADARTQDGY